MQIWAVLAVTFLLFTQLNKILYFVKILPVLTSTANTNALQPS